MLPAFKLFVHYAKMTLFPSVTDVKCWIHWLLPFLVPLHNATVTISNSFTTLFIGSRHIHTSETNQHCYSFLLFIFSFISLSHYYLLTHTQKNTYVNLWLLVAIYLFKEQHKLHNNIQQKKYWSCYKQKIVAALN